MEKGCNVELRGSRFEMEMMVWAGRCMKKKGVGSNGNGWLRCRSYGHG